MQNFKKIFNLLTPYEKKRAILLVIVIIITALLDMIGVVSILPFMAVLSNPGLIETNIILKKMFQTSIVIGVENNQQFLFTLGVMSFLLLVTSLVFKALANYIQVRFVNMRQYSISKRLVENYLHQPYSWFLNRHSADLGKTILSEVNQVIGGGMAPLLDLVAKVIVTILIIILLLIVDPKLALIVGFSFITTYVIIYSFTRSYLRRIGKESLKSNQSRFTVVNEAFGAIKEIKVSGVEKTYLKRFSEPSQTYAKNQAYLSLVSQLPRFAIEAIAFGGIMLLILYLMLQKGSFNNAIPIISLYVFAGYRLMPALQGIYVNFNAISFVGPSLDALTDDFKSFKPFNLKKDQFLLNINKAISLKNIHYNYPNSSRTALQDINISIPAKATVGLVGSTGSGKTTTVDIILGLLEAQKGTLEIDGKIITKQNSKSWQQSIGYVPQNIYLIDDTVAANIAFGEDSKDINQEAVEKASKIANLHEFVKNELPKKYQTTIGERGVRLSGGQRQRIGIARALYHNPQVLILDEATSALDYQTEEAVMDAINNLSKNITIILIAHRLNTVKNCDIIFKLDKGKLIGQGTFEELIKDNENFKITANN